MRKTLTAILFSTVCYAGVPASGAPIAVTLTTADGLGADSFVRGSGAADPIAGTPFRETNYGDRDNAAVKFIRSGIGSGSLTINYESSFTRTAYLRFDLSGISGTVTAATLSLGIRATENVSTIPVIFNTLFDGHAQDAAPGVGGWSESGLTMLNSGLLDDPAALLNPINTVAANLPAANVPSTTTIFDWSHPGLVDALNADTNGLITFVINGAPVTNSLGANFWTKENLEGGFIPTLQLTFEADEVASVAEPGLPVLLGLGLAGLGLIRRRRAAHRITRTASLPDPA